MKQILLLLIALNFCFVETDAQQHKDTLVKRNNTNVDQVVFIDTPRSSFHQKVFEQLLAEIKDDNVSKIESDLPSRNQSIYTGQWITVYKYKNKFFAYYPSEPFYNTFINLSDSALVINDFNEGFLLYAISNKREKANRITFDLVGPTGSKHFLSIKQKTKTLFVINSSFFSGSKLYFVKRKSYFGYPIIVNYCPNNRCPEFSFK